MHIITFRTPYADDVKVPANMGDNILELAQSAGVAIDAPCGGAGTCGKCRLALASGTVESAPGISLSRKDFDDGWRLACQSTVCGDALLITPSESGEFRRGIQTADLSTSAELERHHAAVARIYDAGIAPGRSQAGYGIAVDIGTTTVAAVLADLATCAILGKASMGNGQIRYGADVINRIINQGKPGGVEKLQRAIREETLIPLIEELCQQAGITADQITYCVIAGNTTMEHLFVGADGDSIRLEPFEPAFLELHGKTAADLDLPLAPDAPVVFAPNVGSYVGGDITAGALASMIWATGGMTLFIDLGTNGEIVLGNMDFMLCCACSAGPAFEGGDITCGMRATSGAICACTIDERTLIPAFETIQDAPPAGICGSGIIDIVAELFRTGAISPKGKFVRENDRIRRYDGGAEYVLAFKEDTAGGRDIIINETDLDNFIRAKGAIFSATELMLESIDMPADALDKVIIAGGIGSGINIRNAIAIGMLPNIAPEKYSYIGNSSLTGAYAMLCSAAAEEKVFDIGRNMTYIELSTHPGYMDEFIAACFIPHTDTSLFS